MIRTAYDPKPIPSIQYDWQATDTETDGRAGYGASEREAIDALMDTLGKTGVKSE
jgi:hypothetical protein